METGKNDLILNALGYDSPKQLNCASAEMAINEHFSDETQPCDAILSFIDNCSLEQFFKIKAAELSKSNELALEKQFIDSRLNSLQAFTESEVFNDKEYAVKSLLKVYHFQLKAILQNIEERMFWLRLSEERLDREGE
jgi:hypothetical protein